MSNEQAISYDNYFPEYDEIDLDIDHVMECVFKDLHANQPTDKNSPEIHEMFDFCKNHNEAEVEKIIKNL